LKWRLIKNIETNGAMQMAIDEAILNCRIKGLIPNTLRFFTWNPPCVTIGFFQNLKQEINLEKAKKFGFDVVRRYTGGGAVLHDEELTYSIVIGEENTSCEIIKSYEQICSGIIKGLNLVGIDSNFKSINDIITSGKKISGNAQTRKDGFVLQHGTILLEVDVKKMFSVLKIPDEKIKDKMIKAVEERVTCVSLESKEPISIEELQKAIIKGFEEVFNIEFYYSELTLEEEKIAQHLYETKYSTDDWRFLR